MGSQRFTIPDRLIGLNEYTRLNRAGVHSGHRAKQGEQDTIRWAIAAARLTPVHAPVTLKCHWVERDTRRDKDNIAFSIKFIQDALVDAGVLAGDGWKHIVGFEHTFSVDRDNPRVEVEICEVTHT